jgi:hypothetical protein
MEGKRFPEAGEFLIRSNPIFLLIRGEDREIMVFDATMRIHTSDPKTDSKGRRQVSAKVTEWEAQAHSKMLDADIAFRLTEGGRRPSTVTARKHDADFPATLRFNMDYEVLVNGEPLLRGLSGVATGTINRFPPEASDTFRIKGKRLEIGDIVVDSLVCAC